MPTIALVDDDLEVASVRLYNQAVHSTQYEVSMDDTFPQGHSPLYRRLAQLIQPENDPWKPFSLAVADLVARLTVPGSQWIDENGVTSQMTGNQILVVDICSAE